MTTSNKSIIGNAKSNEFKIEVTSPEELIARYCKPQLEQKGSSKVRKEKKGETLQGIINPNPNPIILQKFEKYDYFFAGKDEYELYQDFVKRNFSIKNGNKLEVISSLANVELEADLFKASSPIINCAMNMALREENSGKQVVTQAQLNYAIQNDLILFLNAYSDTGLCLRTDSGANENHAKNLISQLGENFNLPVYIPIISYDLELDSTNNLKFKIIDRSNILYLPILNSPNQSKFNNSDVDLLTGFPNKFNSEGNKTFWTGPDGLSGVYLEGDILVSCISNLVISNSKCRVVIAKTKKEY